MFGVIAECDVVFRGRIIAVGRSPGFFSGIVKAYQPVTYDIVELLKGQYAYSSVTVFHLLVGGAPTEEPGEPVLRRSMFRRNRRLVIGAKLVSAPTSGLQLFEDVEGAVWSDTPATLGDLRAALAP